MYYKMCYPLSGGQAFRSRNLVFPDPRVSGIVFSRRRARARVPSAAAAPPPPAALLLLAAGLESWPDARLALAGSSCLPILA